MDNWEFRKRPRLEKDENKKDDSDNFRMNGKLKDGNVLSEDNHIYFYSEVSKKTIYELIREIRFVTQKMLGIGKKFNIDPPKIYLHINSYGGSIFAAMAAIDIIIDNPVDIYTIVEGCAASAGTLISVVGKKRFIRKHAHMLIHQLSTTFWGKMQEFEDEMDNLKRLMTLIKNIYDDYTTVPKRKLDEILKHDLWWDADTCLRYSLVDEIM